MDLKRGDLVHIPQAVMLWNSTSENDARSEDRPPVAYIQVERPCTGVYLGTAAHLNHDNLLNVFVKGQRYFVHSRDVYPLLGE